MHNEEFKISRKAASHIISAMIAGGVFTRLAIDGSNEYLNSMWICLLGGFFIGFPLIIIIDKYNVCASGKIWNIACVPAAGYMLFQAASISRLLVNSVSYSNYNTFQPEILSLVMVLACLYIINKGTGGLGNAVKVCGIPFLILLAVVILCNLKYSNIRWLTPFISADLGNIIKGSFYVAGYILSAATLYIPAQNCGPYRNGCLRAVVIGCGIAFILCIYVSIQTPMQPDIDLNRLKSIEMLLSNGRTSLGVQLPITLMWFIGYIIVLASYAFAGAIFMHQAFNNIPILLTGIISVVIIYVLANLGLAESRQTIFVSRLAFIGACVIVFIAYFTRGKVNDPN